jgi:predicted Zn finger-like uncharacterized protein
MFTTCTNCHTRFRLNVAQLTAAQGQVRCGKCGEIFDAYAVLEGAEVAPQMPAPAAPEEAMPMEALPPDAPEMVMSPEGEVAPEVELSLPVEDEPITTAPVLRASRKSKLPIEDMFASLPPDEPGSEPERMSAIPVEADAAGSMGEVAADAARGEAPPSSYAHVDLLHAPPAPKPRRPWASAGLWTIIVLLLLLLGAQLVDLDRAALSQNPVIGPSLKALYAALGHPINNPSAVSEWNVGGLNVTTDPDSNGALSITGSLANHAAFVQPWPLLRVVLTDRFGETLRSRDFKPADYLAPAQAASLLAPGLAASFRLDIVDPGADAVGFSLTPCLDTPAGRVCAVANATD